MKPIQMWHRLRFGLGRRKFEQELRAEMEDHIELVAAELSAQGMPLDEARRAARLRFGNAMSLREESRSWWGFPSFESIVQDLRFGARLLLRSPAVTLIAVLTLAIGIGANTAVFSAVNALLLRPLPYAQPERLVSAWQTADGWTYIPLGAFLAHAERSRTMDLAGCNIVGLNLNGEGDAVHLHGSMVSANFFSVLAVKPFMGRGFREGENSPGHDNLVILSHALWQTRFHGDANILGRSVDIDGTNREVVGVMPAGFSFPGNDTALWIPINTGAENVWGNTWVSVVGRLRSGYTLTDARSELKALVPQIVAQIPWHMPAGYGTWADVFPLQEQLVSGFRAKLLMLLGSVGLVLLIACANVANLLLARAAGRQREIAVRMAIGAGRVRILRQLVTESFLLALVGGSVGLLLAPLGSLLVQTILPQGSQAHYSFGYGFANGLPSMPLDLRVLGFVFAIAVITGVGFGLAPALHANRIDLDQALRSTARSSNTRQRHRLSSSLVIGETALAMVLAVSAGLLVRSLWMIAHEPSGFRTDGLVTAKMTPSSSMCEGKPGNPDDPKPARCAAFYDSVLAGARSLPGVQSAAYADAPPYGEIRNTVIAAENHPQYNAGSPYQVLMYTVSPAYFQTLSVPLLKGRTFAESDGSKSPGVVIVSRKMAERLWPGEDPIGKRVTPSWMVSWRTVVGVVADVRPFGVSPGSWADPEAGAVYFPHRQGLITSPTLLTILLRTSEPDRVAAELPKLVAGVGASVPVTDVVTMQQLISKSIAVPRSTTWLFSAFAALALALGAVGLYSLISYTVTAQTKEIGIRMALGADRGSVLRGVLGHGVKLAFAGVLIGVAGSLALGRLLQSFLYGVKPSDPATLAAVAGVLVLVALAAAYVPARRAASVDPMTALRYE